MRIEVTAAIIRNDRGECLIAKRGLGSHLGGLWDFAGGKLEAGEGKVECLKREITEELGIEITVEAPFLAVDHSYGEKHIRLHSFMCSYVSGEVVLKDHDEVAWVTISELASYEFAPADIPIVKKLQDG